MLGRSTTWDENDNNDDDTDSSSFISSKKRLKQGKFRPWTRREVPDEE